MRTGIAATFVIALAGAAPTMVLAQGAPAPASPQQVESASRFVDSLAGQAFAILRDKSLTRDAAKTRLRALLKENFALDEAGLRLIRRYRASLTPQQLANYRAALPDFLVGTYADRLFEFANATVKVVRASPRGSRGEVDVYSSVSDPKGDKPIDAIWAIKTAGPRPLVVNLTVNGVNVALTQEADFSAYIDKNGFDALIEFMRQKR
jgi:phospholipid transport system substrate-binding protein